MLTTITKHETLTKLDLIGQERLPQEKHATEFDAAGEHVGLHGVGHHVRREHGVEADALLQPVVRHVAQGVARHRLCWENKATSTTNAMKSIWKIGRTRTQ